jgi:hypothetical protein
VSSTEKVTAFEYGLTVNQNLPKMTDHRIADEQVALAPLRAVANRCASGNCPTVYVSGSGTLVVQGYAVSAESAGVDLPDGETMVEIPLELFTEAVRNLQSPD